MIPELRSWRPLPAACRWLTGCAKRCAPTRFTGRSARNENEPQRFRQYLEQKPGEKVLLVDDILRSGNKLAELKKLVESNGGEVVGLAVVIYQPNPKTIEFDPLPFYYPRQAGRDLLQGRQPRAKCASAESRPRRFGFKKVWI